MPHDVVIDPPRVSVQLSPGHGPARGDRRMVSSIVTLPRLGQPGAEKLLADAAKVRSVPELPDQVLEVEVLCVLGGLCPRVGDVARGVEPLRDSHGVLRTNSQPGAGH